MDLKSILIVILLALLIIVSIMFIGYVIYEFEPTEVHVDEDETYINETEIDEDLLEIFGDPEGVVEPPPIPEN